MFTIVWPGFDVLWRREKKVNNSAVRRAPNIYSKEFYCYNCLTQFEHTAFATVKKYTLETIISELKSGDNNYLEYIFIEYSVYCITNLQKKVKCSKEEAEDIFIEAVMNFRDKIITGKVDYLTSVRNYLYTTCYNMWLERYRRYKRYQEGLPDIVRFYQEELNETDVVELEKQEKFIRITNEALGKLGEKCKDIISYFYLENKRMAEIAQIMNFSSADVAKTTKSRCFKKLLDEVRMMLSPENKNNTKHVAEWERIEFNR